MGGLFSGVGHALGGLFGNGSDFQDRLARAQAMLNGDYAGAASIGENSQLRRLKIQQQKKAQEDQAQLDAMIDSDTRLNTPQLKAYAKANPKAYIDNVMQQFQPRQFGPGGGSLGLPDASGHLTFQMAPSRHEYQGSVFDVGSGPEGQQASVTPQHEGTQWVTPQPGTTAFGVNSFSGARRSGEAAPPDAGQNPDATPTIEDGHAYRPGPGGRANPSNWIPLAQGGAGRSAPPTFP